MSKKMMATLTAEHLVVLEMADKFRDNLEKLQTNQALPGVQEGLWEFSRLMDHTVNQHIPQEEDELFPKLLKANPGIMEQVNTMLEEHKVISQAHRSLREELMGDKPAPEIIIESGTRLLGSLETHIKREHDALTRFSESKR